MKRQNHGMTINLDSQWPIEDIREMNNYLQEKNHVNEIGKHIAAKAREKAGLSSEHYQRAVADMAYGLWEERGRLEGGSEADWFKAEETLKPLWSADLPFASMDTTSEN